MGPVLVPLLIFAATYAVISGAELPLLRLDRTSAALVGAVAMVALGGLPLAEAWRAVNLETLGLLLGMMIITGYLIEAGFFRALAWETIARSGSARRLLVALVLVSGALAALFVNDTICVMFTPLVVTIVDEAALPALPFLLALTTATNLGGVATYTGNPQNMIIGTHADLSFARYLLHMLPVAVVGLAADAALLLILFRRELPDGPLPAPRSARPPLDGKLVARCLAALAFALAGFLLGYSLPGAALAAAALLVVIARRPPKVALHRVDFSLLLFFAALFVVVSGVAHAGVLERANAWLAPRLAARPGEQLVQFSFITVVGSNLFSNVPWVLLSLGTVPHLADPERGWLALAMASTLAGNLTIFGSVANLIVLELAGAHGKVGFVRFLRYGFVVTVVTLALGIGVLFLQARLGF
jgi:Na+/H+ antiporter NhaD/arsenite permease-like protein